MSEQPPNPQGQNAACQAQVGMLVLRNCGQPASATCAQCQRPICDTHQIGTVENTIICPECAGVAADKLPPAKQGTAPPEVQRVQQRRMWGTWSPYFFGRSIYYSDDYHGPRDYDVFDRRGAFLPGGGPMQSHAHETEPVDKDYDPRES